MYTYKKHIYSSCSNNKKSKLYYIHNLAESWYYQNVDLGQYDHLK